MSLGNSLSARGSCGLSLYRETAGLDSSGPAVTWSLCQDPQEALADQAKNVKVMKFNRSGDQFAWSNGEKVVVVGWSESHWRVVTEIAHARASYLAFSPRGSILATWEVFSTKSGQQPEANLHLWDPQSGGRLASFIQKKVAFWCPQWSEDEVLCCLRSPNHEVHCYRDGDFERVDQRLSVAKLESFSLAPLGQPSYHVIGFIPGQHGGPGFGKLFRYPNFHPETGVVAQKSFFQSDCMDVTWSYDGRFALLLTTSDVDKTGASYYGKQQLHFMSIEGDTAMVQLAKEGPIYSHQWSPTEALFCAVYGYMPAKATLYNRKCEKVFDYGTGPRNSVLFNSTGNLLLLGGFGNLRGNVEIWGVKSHKQVCQFEATNATDIRWSPNGKYIMGSTCAPRLRQSNGFKIWHYTSSLIFDHEIETPGEELWEVAWQNAPADQFHDFQIQTKPIDGIKPKQPVASKEAYRPPCARNKEFTFKLREDDEPAENQKNGVEEELSKSAAKNRRRRQNRKERIDTTPGSPVEVKEEKTEPSGYHQAIESTGDPEKDKKIRKLNDKLGQIRKLKERLKEGDALEINQLDKIKKEDELINEINQLKL